MNRDAGWQESLLIGCARAHLKQQPFLPPLNTNWCALLESAYRQKVAPVVWTVLAQQPEVVPAEIWAAFTGWMENLRRKNSYFALHLRRLTALLSDEGIPTLSIKGLALASGAYGSLSLRQFEDIDLLIPAEHIYRALRIAQDQGFEFKSARLRDEALSALPPDDFHFQLKHPRWFISLELHWKVGWRRYNARDFPLSFSELAADAHELTLLNSSIRTPSPLHTVILLGIDSLKEPTVPLGRVLDVALILRQPSFDWAALWSTAERVRAFNETAALVGAASILFDLPAPSALAIAQPRPVVRAAIQKIIRDGQPEQRQTRLEWLYLLWRLRSGRGEKLFFARQLIATPEYREYFGARIVWDALRVGVGVLRLDRLLGVRRFSRAFRPWFERGRRRFRRRW